MPATTFAIQEVTVEEHTEERLEEVLRDIRIKAETLPPEQFLAMMDKLVESSRRYIAACEDDAVRGDLRQMYQGIVRYAMDCQMRTSMLH